MSKVYELSINNDLIEEEESLRDYKIRKLQEQKDEKELQIAIYKYDTTEIQQVYVEQLKREVAQINNQLKYLYE